MTVEAPYCLQGSVEVGWLRHKNQDVVQEGGDQDVIEGDPVGQFAVQRRFGERICFRLLEFHDHDNDAIFERRFNGQQIGRPGYVAVAALGEREALVAHLRC